jgi:hypothetical protein
MKKIKFSQIKHKIVNNPGFQSLKEIKEAGYRIVKERDSDRKALDDIVFNILGLTEEERNEVYREGYERYRFQKRI